MQFLKTNHEIIVTYGAGSRNAPALYHNMYSVGHLRVTSFIKLLKIQCYEQFKCLC